MAVPSVENPSFHIDWKVQQSDPRPKTTLVPQNALAKIQLMKELKDELGRLVPVLIVNPMGARPVVRRNDSKVKGLWIRYRVLFVAAQGDGQSETVTWKEVVLLGVTAMQLLTNESLDQLKTLLEFEVANIDLEVFEPRIREIETRLTRKFGRIIASVSDDSKGEVLSELVAESVPEVQERVIESAVAQATPEVQERVIESAVAQATPEVRGKVLGQWSVAELEAELARRKAGQGNGRGQKKKK